MDPLHLAIALIPLAVYLLVMGSVNLARRPFVSTGSRDAAALGLSIVGFAVVGPMELFFPEEAASEFGGVWFVWLLMLSLYALGLMLLLLLMRPRLIIYNASSEELRPALARAVERLDQKAMWAADSLVLPTIGVQFHIDAYGAMRTAQLVSSGVRQNYLGWRNLERTLVEELKGTRSQRNPFAFLLVAVGLAMLVVVTLAVVRDPQTLAHSIQEFLQ